MRFHLVLAAVPLLIGGCTHHAAEGSQADAEVAAGPAQTDTETPPAPPEDAAGDSALHDSDHETTPDTAEPDTAEPDTAEPDTAEPDTAEPDTAEPDTAEPDTTEPDTTEPDTAEPDTVPPATCETLGCGANAACVDQACICDPGYSGDADVVCKLTDGCKTVPAPGSVARLIYTGSGTLQKPTSASSPPQVAIEPPGDCQGGKIDIVILPEGYKSGELGRFELDAGRWLDQFLNRSPWSEHLGAFNVWIVPLASEEHLEPGPNSASGTRFKLALNDSGSGIRLPSSSSNEWLQWESAFFDALDHISRNRIHRYPDDGKRNANLAIQTVGVILAYRSTSCGSLTNPNATCDGYSGYARTLENPDGSGERVRVAVARNRMHEFGHAFGAVADEYRADDFEDKCLGASYLNGYNADTWTIRTINNYAYASDASQLPWQHLLYGAGINKTPGLVGAFQGANTCWEGAWRPEYRCLMNGRHGNGDACTDEGLSLRQTDFCNWCREIMVMRIYEKIGWLSGADELADWADNWRDHYWRHNPMTLPNAGLPALDSCDDPRVFEAAPTGVPCPGHTNAECVDDDIAPKCGWHGGAGIDYCTRPCETDDECGDLFNNGCCAMGTFQKMCRPAVDPRCLAECYDEATMDHDADLCDDHVPETNWCGFSVSQEISYCTRTCETYADCLDLFVGGPEFGCCAAGSAGVKLCRPAASPKCP